MLEQDREVIESKLHELTLEHRDLDDVINRLSTDPMFDQLQLRRMKQRKLLLKDQISLLHSKLIPDIRLRAFCANEKVRYRCISLGARFT